jgi:glycosyltransferase involved in cell wall biosynthesis
MRILYSIHLYPPKHNCGGEYYIHNLNKYLISQGHEVRVMLHQAKQHNIRTPYEFEGVEVIGCINHLDAYRWADVLVTHLDFTHFTVLLGRDIGKPVVHIVHNHHRYESVANSRGSMNVVYNSQWIADKLQYDWPSIVVPPTIDVEKYNVTDDPSKNEFITLINLNTNKGGRILQKLAAIFPNKKFLAVKGSYDKQITDQPSNVTVIPNTPDILNVYRQTKILLMPSQYESWGMTATEAMCSGIPVICTPTPGLSENCGKAALYITPRNAENFDEHGNVLDDSDEYDISSLVDAVRRLDKPKEYERYSRLSRERSLEHEPLKRMKDYEEFLFKSYYGVNLKAYV